MNDRNPLRAPKLARLAGMLDKASNAERLAYGTPMGSIAWHISSFIANQGDKRRHGPDKAHGELMSDKSEGLEEHRDDATTWPCVTALQLKVHGELTQDGSRGQVELIGGTTT
ncbi:hypothetical protein CJ030_MR7G028099 [Morella rubra]|uniref:Uncharacterized protein n=1 Tax=Morella rubra TaxID=262757 RepID=A0A6A1V051_9ROSI|nr:hypothetical protein CJ030_MR7G028099 [Morella rubra]